MSSAEDIRPLLELYRADISDLKAKRAARDNRLYLQQLLHNEAASAEDFHVNNNSSSNSNSSSNREESSDLKRITKESSPKKSNLMVANIPDGMAGGISGDGEEFIEPALPSPARSSLQSTAAAEDRSGLPFVSLPPLPVSALAAQRTRSRESSSSSNSGAGSGRNTIKMRSSGEYPDLRVPSPQTVFRSAHNSSYGSSSSYHSTIGSGGNYGGGFNVAAAMMTQQSRGGRSQGLDSAAAAVGALLKERQVQNILDKRN